MTVSKARLRANAKYAKAHYRRIATVVTIEQKEYIQAAAEKAGESLSQYMKKAIFTRIESEKK